MAEKEEKLSFDVKDCACEEVIVYQDSAEVCRGLTAKLRKGENELVLGGVSDRIDKDSIRVDGKGTAVILEVSLQTRHLNKEEQNENQEQVKELEKELERKRQEETTFNNKLERFRKERAVLEKFSDQVVTGKPDEKGNQLPLTMDSLDSMIKFFTVFDEQAEKFDKGIQDTQEVLNKIRDELRTLRRNIQQLTVGPASKEKSEISVLVESPDDQEVDLSVKYLVSNAAWQPKYDLRVSGQDKLLKLHYYGFIRQSTGEDWNDAKLTLSTAKPSVGGKIPSLGIQNVKYKEKYIPIKKAKVSFLGGRGIAARAAPPMGAFSGPPAPQAMSMVAMDAECFMAEESYNSVPDMATMTMEARGNLLSTMYEIPRKTTVPSDNTSHKVTVAIVDLEPVFSYACHPRLTTDVFLKAKIKNTSSYAMIGGPANVFLDNNFVCKTELDDVSPGEEFSCSLGTDASIRVTYPPVHKHHDKTGMFTKVHNQTYTQEIKIKNTRQETISLQLVDHIPRPAEEKIKVQLLEPKIQRNDKEAHSSPRLNPNTQHVTWDLDVTPNEPVKLILKYSLEYPAGEEIDFQTEHE